MRNEKREKKNCPLPCSQRPFIQPSGVDERRKMQSRVNKLHSFLFHQSRSRDCVDDERKVEKGKNETRIGRIARDADSNTMCMCACVCVCKIRINNRFLKLLRDNQMLIPNWSWAFQLNRECVTYYAIQIKMKKNFRPTHNSDMRFSHETSFKWRLLTRAYVRCVEQTKLGCMCARGNISRVPARVYVCMVNCVNVYVCVCVRVILQILYWLESTLSIHTTYFYHRIICGRARRQWPLIAITHISLDVYFFLLFSCYPHRYIHIVV